MKVKSPSKLRTPRDYIALIKRLTSDIQMLCDSVENEERLQRIFARTSYGGLSIDELAEFSKKLDALNNNPNADGFAEKVRKLRTVVDVEFDVRCMKGKL